MGKTVVKISCGRLRGTIQKSIEGFDYYAFKGVPYAKPPIGELRFQDPQPPEPWKGIKNANEFGSPCAQFDQLARLYLGCDDCLYLNIYTKSLKPNSRFPVMMWIHGGAFTFGCGDDSFYGPDYLIKKDVVLVTVNYRLGVFGFLNLEDEVAPGNQGLKDLVMALKWIQVNIGQFGGDPKSVTVFGESSGAACVNFLGLSPLAKGLLHKAILQSGTALCTWATVPKSPKKYAYTLCKLLGRELYDHKEIVEFLKTIDSIELAKMQEKMRTLEEKLQLLYPFGPGVDDKSANPFMPIPVSLAAENGLEIPFIVGYNNREGVYALITLQSQSYEDLDKNFSSYIHPHLKDTLQKYKLSPDDLRIMYNSKEITKESYAEKFADLFGDMYIVEGCHRMIKLHILKNQTPIYFYKFTYDKGISFTKLLMNTSITGASHFDEIPHLFYMKFCENIGVDPLQKGTTSYRLMDQMTEIWTNFAKTGRPTPVTSELIRKKWAPVTNPTLLRYMHIDEELKMDSMMNVEQRLSREKFMSNLAHKL